MYASGEQPVTSETNWRTCSTEYAVIPDMPKDIPLSPSTSLRIFDRLSALGWDWWGPVMPFATSSSRAESTTDAGGDQVMAEHPSGTAALGTPACGRHREGQGAGGSRRVFGNG